MAGPALSAIPMAAGGGGMAPLTQGAPTAISELAGAFSPDYQRQLQLKKLLEQQQMYQASQFQRDALLQQLQASNDPNKDSDPRMMQLLKQSYRGTGVAPAISPGQKASPGLSTPQTQDDKLGTTLPGLNRPAQAAQGPQINEAALSGNTFPAYVMKNHAEIVQTKPEDRIADAEAQGLKLTDQQKQLLQSLPYQMSAATTKVQEDAVAKLDTNTRQMLKLGVDNGSFDQIKAAVKFYQTGARNTPGADPTQFDSYLQEQIAALSPMKIAKIAQSTASAGKDDEQARVMQALLQPRIDALKATTQQREATVNHLSTVDREINTLLKGKNDVNVARAQQLIAQAKRDYSSSGLLYAQAQWYSAKVKNGELAQDPAEMRAGIVSLSQGRDTAMRTVSSLQQAQAALSKTQGYGVIPDVTAAVDAQSKAMQPDIDAARAEAKQYQDDINSVTGQSVQLPSGGGVPAQPTSGGAAPPAQAAGALPSPKTPQEITALKVGTKFTAGGKTYVRTAVAPGYAAAQ